MRPVATPGVPLRPGVALARWRHLVLDVEDPDLMVEFWAGVSGLDVVPLAERGEAGQERWLRGPTSAHAVRVQRADSPRRSKNRVHLDVDAPSVAALEALGARVLQPAEETGHAWTVMADPEGGELCCFVRADVPAYRIHGVVVDCADPQELARWWGSMLGTTPVVDDAGEVHTLEGVGPDERLTIDFVAVPEPRIAPDRVHVELVGDRDALVALGAVHRWDAPGHTVLADPEGNDVGVVAPRPEDLEAGGTD